MLERSAIANSSYPDKKRIEQLLDDIDTRMPIFDYENVYAGDRLDTTKLNEDLAAIKKDLEILYEIISELAGEKYTKLEAYVNGYLSSLEAAADEADERARKDYESTSLGAKTVYFKQGLPSMSIESEAIVLSLGSIKCSADSRVYGVIDGYGFSQENVVFDFDGKRISPYDVNRETLPTGGTTKKTSYTYTLPEDSPYHASFKIANSSIAVDEGYRYEAYGAANHLSKSVSDSDSIISFQNGTSYDSTAETRYVFYLMNATYIRFDFSEAPESRNFAEDDVMNMQRDKVYKYELVMPKGSSFNIDTDGITYATKENLAINGKELYIVGTTQAEDFLINVYEPGTPVTFKSVKVLIYGAEEDAFSVSSVAVKEYTEESA